MCLSPLTQVYDVQVDGVTVDQLNFTNTDYYYSSANVDIRGCRHAGCHSNNVRTSVLLCVCNLVPFVLRCCVQTQYSGDL